MMRRKDYIVALLEETEMESQKGEAIGNFIQQVMEVVGAYS